MRIAAVLGTFTVGMGLAIGGCSQTPKPVEPRLVVGYEPGPPWTVTEAVDGQRRPVTIYELMIDDRLIAEVTVAEQRGDDPAGFDEARERLDLLAERFEAMGMDLRRDRFGPLADESENAGWPGQEGWIEYGSYYLEPRNTWSGQRRDAGAYRLAIVATAATTLEITTMLADDARDNERAEMDRIVQRLELLVVE